MGQLVTIEGINFEPYKICSIATIDGVLLNDISEIIVGEHFGGTSGTIADKLTTTTNRATTTDVLNTTDFVGKKIYIPDGFLITKVQATALTQIYTDVKSTDPGWQTPNASGYVEFDFDSDYQYLVFSIKKSDNTVFSSGEITYLQEHIFVS